MAEYDRGKAARVKELCRLLKPVIGDQAERIWMGYIAEDETGKAQLLDYLEILASQKFNATLDDQGPGLLPPGEATAAGAYHLGTVAYNARSMYPFGLREGEWPQHVGVFGRSGSGKTNLGFLIVQDLIRAGKPVLIFDWKRNYRDLATLPGFENLAIYTGGRSTAPLRFNPLIPPPDTSPQTWIKKLIAVLAHAYLLGDGVMFLLQEAIDATYNDFGIYEGSIERWPTFHDVLDRLRARKAAGREAGWMSSALRALGSVCFGEMDTLVNHGHDRVEDLLARPVVLELDALTQSDKVFVTQALLLWIHHLRMTEPVRETLKSAIVIEEAHHILSGERRSLVGGQGVMELAFREIREFGTAIILLDQMPSTIAPSALANTYAVFCFNLKHRADVTAMTSAMLLDDDEKAVLGNLQIGEAVVRLQGRSARPFMIHIPEFEIQKGAFTDAHVRQHMTRLGLLSARRQEPTRPRGSAKLRNDESNAHHADTNIAGPLRALMMDIADFPKSGVAERYRRLGLSVRLGQKIKEELVSRHLIQEEIQTTSRGKTRVVRLTDQGRLMLEPPSEA
ncbi:MAG: ATP-binding protein [Phycisphaerales bacterium]|nr:ATP-binding protein [Phycisphaerales bacterium]MCB9855297.1 ATP-binding protein [Phycisphaerales bacterium]MCB9862890.1 ATP-binding protein [Phycisphaerales bacterium]